MVAPFIRAAIIPSAATNLIHGGNAVGVDKPLLIRVEACADDSLWWISSPTIMR